MNQLAGFVFHVFFVFASNAFAQDLSPTPNATPPASVIYSDEDVQSGKAYQDNCRFVTKQKFDISGSCSVKTICEGVIHCKEFSYRATTPGPASVALGSSQALMPFSEGVQKVSGLFSISCAESNCRNVGRCAADKTLSVAVRGPSRNPGDRDVSPKENLEMKGGKAQ